MAACLNLTAIAAHLGLDLTGEYVGTCYDRDYLVMFPKTFPAVWVAAQRMNGTSSADEGGFSGYFRQHCRVDVAIRIVVQRYIDGSIDGEARLNDLADAVVDSLKDWTPPGADTPLTILSAQDGDATDTLMTVDLVFTTSATYARPS